MLLKLATVSAFSIISSWFNHSGADNFTASPPVHIRHHSATASPIGFTPTQIKTAYKLDPSLTAGTGKTIAIVDAYDDPYAASNLTYFSSHTGLGAFPTCNRTLTTTCFQQVKMSSRLRANTGWALEESLDIQWAHAIAPGAKILLVEAASASGNDLLKAVDYARGQKGVVSVSMSWGGSEFSGQASLDGHFTPGTSTPVSFFASSGDNGTGVSWPAVSTNVIGVGGTSLTLKSDNTIASEQAWSGSGGGISTLNSEPTYQSLYGVKSNNKRGVPDVSYDADPNTGFPVYDTYGYGGWVEVGGTSAGAPQWAAINAINPVTSSKLYTDAGLSGYFNDIILGTNGGCTDICTAGQKYDFVTGLGTPARTLGVY